MKHVLISAYGYELLAAPFFAGLAGLASFLWLRRSREYMKLSLDDFWGLVLVLVPGVIGGALLFYALFYNGGPVRNLAVLIGDKKVPGGSFWGSFWVAAAVAYLYCRFRKIEFRPVADAVGLSALLGLAVMRVGCFLHGCCHGAPSGLPWAVTYTDPRCAVSGPLLGVPLHPAQLYESVGALALFAAVYFGLFRKGRLKPGGAFALSIILYSVFRFIVEFSRGGDQGVLAGHFLTTAQYISILSAVGSVIWYRRL